MTYEQLERALARLQEWNTEIDELRRDNYDPHGYSSDRLKEIEELKKQELEE
jgi:hypothetical protein